MPDNLLANMCFTLSPPAGMLIYLESTAPLPFIMLVNTFSDELGAVKP